MSTEARQGCQHSVYQCSSPKAAGSRLVGRPSNAAVMVQVTGFSPHSWGEVCVKGGPALSSCLHPSPNYCGQPAGGSSNKSKGKRSSLDDSDVKNERTEMRQYYLVKPECHHPAFQSKREPAHPAPRLRFGWDGLISKRLSKKQSKFLSLHVNSVFREECDYLSP